MKLVADEGVDRQIVQRLRTDGHEVEYVAEMAPGLPDDEVLLGAVSRGAVLLTGDKDFGELVYRRGQASAGVVLVRLAGLPSDRKADIVSQAIAQHHHELQGFTVVSPGMVRVRKRISE